MATAPEIIDLFARLASHLDGSASSYHHVVEEEDQESLELSISNLNRSLNLDDDDSRVSVLDTALSLMCFKAPQVFDSAIKYLVETIVTVLSSSISCKVLRFQNEEVLLIGCSISCRDCADLIESCSDVLGKLEGHGPHYKYLFSAVLRVAISSSCYRFPYPSRPVFYVKSIDSRSMAVSKIFSDSSPWGFCLDGNQIPFRLMSWFLDPLILNHDISNVLHELVERPFLCLCQEFHERMDWRSIITCLVLCPLMFIETRALLHRWFLLTGVAAVLELLTVLCSVMLDVISRPTWWDISMDLGAKLPFSNAYFPYHQNILWILAGPLSDVSLLHLVHVTSELVSCTGKQFDAIIKTPAIKAETIDHKSSWALAINFPNWFYFASALLFSEKSFHNNIHSKCMLEASKIVYEELPSAAARYIAWILNPVSKTHQDMLVACLVKISKLLASKQFGSGTYEKKTTSDRKILKKPKFCDKEYGTPPEQYNCQTVALWLLELQKVYMMYWTKSSKNSASCNPKTSCDLSMQQNTLFRRIPLGILLGHLNYLEEGACELLLHYATTEMETSSLKKMKCNYEGQKDIIAWIDDYLKEEAVAGAHLVFCLTDIVESMSSSLFESEEAGVDFICQVKMRVGKYLIKCVKRQIQLKIVEDGNVLVMDLCKRLKQWAHQGQRALEIHKDIDDLIDVLTHKLSSF